MNTKIWIRPVLSIASCIAIGSITLATTYTVDDSGGFDFTDIQSAVDAAIDGDSIMIRPGTYTDFTIEDKTLNVFAEPDTGAVNVNGSVFVVNVSKFKRVVLSGIKVTGRTVYPLSEQGLVMNLNLGSVRIQNCTFKGGAGAPLPPWSDCFDGDDYGSGGLAVDLFYCTDLAFVGCTLTGGNGFGGPCLDSPGGDGGKAVDARTSQVALYDCTVRGGDGGDVDDGFGGNGGTAYHNPTGGFFASGSSFQGGAGGDTDYFGDTYAGDGGHGIFVGANGNAQLLDDTYVGGMRGVPHFHGLPGVDGLALTGTGDVQFITGTRRKFTAPRIAAPNSLITVTILGQSGDQVFLPWSNASAWRFQLVNKGTWLIPLPARRSTQPIGVIPASGSLTTMIQLAPLPPGLNAALTSMQCLVIDTQGNAILGSPMHVLRK